MYTHRVMANLLVLHGPTICWVLFAMSSQVTTYADHQIVVNSTATLSSGSVMLDNATTTGFVITLSSDDSSSASRQTENTSASTAVKNFSSNVDSITTTELDNSLMHAEIVSNETTTNGTAISVESNFSGIPSDAVKIQLGVEANKEETSIGMTLVIVSLMILGVFFVGCIASPGGTLYGRLCDWATNRQGRRGPQGLIPEERGENLDLMAHEDDDVNEEDVEEEDEPIVFEVNAE